MMRLISALFLATFFSPAALANGWETVGPIAGDQKSLLLSYNAGTIRALLERRCQDTRVACVVAVSRRHPKRQQYAEHWYQQCLIALTEARSAKASWQIHDRKKANEEWLIEPGKTIGAELVCEVKPPMPPPSALPPLPPPKVKEDEAKLTVAPPMAKPTAAAPAAVSVRPLPVRTRDQIEFVVAGLAETWYALARGELDGMGVGSVGLELKLADDLFIGLRAEAGSSQRAGAPYLWVGGMANVSVPLVKVIETGGFVRWHHGLIGLEPYRDRVSVGGRVVIPKFIADNLGLEVLISGARDLTPGYEVENGKYTEANDLTIGLAVGVLWLPFL